MHAVLKIDVAAENITPDMTVTLRPGHVLYLPAYWYHRVTSKVDCPYQNSIESF